MSQELKKLRQAVASSIHDPIVIGPNRQRDDNYLLVDVKQSVFGYHPNVLHSDHH
jgi:hypothetical protein